MQEYRKKAQLFRDMADGLRDIASEISEPDQLTVHDIADIYDQMAQEEEAKITATRH